MEKNISDIDANFRNASIDGLNLEFHDGYSEPIHLEGFPFINKDGSRGRLPLEAAKQCLRDGVIPMSRQGAGEMLRFRTDSPYFGIRATFHEIYSGNLRSGSAGFDAYWGIGNDSRFLGNRVIPPNVSEFTAVWSSWLPKNGEMYDITIHFPYHCSVAKICVGLRPGARLESPTPYRHKKPVVFYGSSITNCGAATRPGLSYPVIIGRLLDTPIVNMGFSGSCKGDLVIADEIAKLDLSALVVEYDHNAPDKEFLEKTHELFFQHFRQLRPDVPVLLMSRCDVYLYDDDFRERRDVIVRTWRHAVEAGDKLVDFLDGETLFAGPHRFDCTNDGCHPNDYGEMIMAERIADRVRPMIVGK